MLWEASFKSLHTALLRPYQNGVEMEGAGHVRAQQQALLILIHARNALLQASALGTSTDGHDRKVHVWTGEALLAVPIHTFQCAFR